MTKQCDTTSDRLSLSGCASSVEKPVNCRQVGHFRELNPLSPRGKIRVSDRTMVEFDRSKECVQSLIELICVVQYSNKQLTTVVSAAAKSPREITR